MRTAVPGDAASLLRLKQRLDQETSFMLLEVGERDTGAQVLARQRRTHPGEAAWAGADAILIA